MNDSFPAAAVLRRLRRALAALLCASAAASALQADEYHYNNILVGDRASGMGGAYTAVSDDPSGLYYNPAGIVYAVGSNISGSMNAYHTTRTRYRSVLGGSGDWERQSAAFLPNFFGIVQNFGQGKVGFSYAVIDTVLEDQDQTFTAVQTLLGNDTDIVVNFNNQDNSFVLGPSYARRLNDDLAVGVTLYGYYRKQKRILNIVFTEAGGDYEWHNQYFSLRELGAMPMLGVMWSPFDRVSLGLSLRKTVVLDTARSTLNTCQGAATISYAPGSDCSTGTLTHSEVTGTDNNSYPYTFTVGAAWFYSSRLLVTADGSYYLQDGDGQGVRTSTWNAAAGMEYYLRPQWALRGGLFSNNASTPGIDTSGTVANQPEHTDLYGISFSVSHFNRNSSLTVGGAWNYGQGQAQIIAGSSSVQDMEIAALTLFMSAAYSY